MLTSEQKDKLRHAIEYYVYNSGMMTKLSDVLAKVATKTDEQCIQFIADYEFNKAIDETPKPIRRKIIL